MSIFEQIELEEKIMKTCKMLHKSLAADNEDSEDSLMTPEEVNQLEPIEALHHMTEAIKDMLSQQRNLKTYTECSGFGNSEAVQTVLQKLEADVREHIKIENQLKLYCENLEEKLEKNETSIKMNESSCKELIEQQEKENDAMRRELKVLEEEILKLKGKASENYKESENNKEPESEIQAENDQRSNLLMDKCIRIKRLREVVKNKALLCKELSKENKEMVELVQKLKQEKNMVSFPSVTYFKIKYKEQCKEILELKKRLKKASKPAKSQSPFVKTAANSISPLSKKNRSRDISSKLSRQNSKSGKSLLRTLHNPASKL